MKNFPQLTCTMHCTAANGLVQRATKGGKNPQVINILKFLKLSVRTMCTLVEVILIYLIYRIYIALRCSLFYLFCTFSTAFLFKYLFIGFFILCWLSLTTYVLYLVKFTSTIVLFAQFYISNCMSH